MLWKTLIDSGMNNAVTFLAEYDSSQRRPEMRDFAISTPGQVHQNSPIMFENFIFALRYSTFSAVGRTFDFSHFHQISALD